MSSVNSTANNYIDSLDITLENLGEMSEEEIQELIENITKDMSPDELEAFWDDLDSDLDEAEVDVDHAQDDIDEAKDEVSSGSDEYDALTDLEDQFLDISDNIDTAQKVASEEADKSVLLNKDVEAYESNEVNSDDHKDVEGGEEVNYYYNGTTDLFDTNDFNTYLEEEGIVQINDDGSLTVIKDLTGEGDYNYADIEFAKSTFESLQSYSYTYLNLDYAASAVSYDAETCTLTLRVDRPESSGGPYYITLHDLPSNARIVAEGQTFQNTEALEVFPEEVQKMLYIGDSDKNVFVELNGGEEISQEDRLKVIPGYAELTSDYSAAAAYTDQPEGLTAAQEEDVAEAMTKLLEFYDSTDIAKDSTTVISEIQSDWKAEGLSDEEISIRWQYLLGKVFVTNPEVSPTMFDTFFGDSLTTLQTYVTIKDSESADGITNASKIFITLLATQCSGAAGSADATTGDSDALAYASLDTLYGTDDDAGGWENGSFIDESQNAEVFADYLDLVSSAGGLMTGKETAISNHLAGKTKGSTEKATGTTTISWDEDTYSRLALATNRYGKDYGVGMFDGITVEHLTSSLNGLITDVDTLLRQGCTVTQLMVEIQQYILGLDADWQDDVAAAFIRMLHDIAPDVLKALKQAGYAKTLQALYNNDEWFDGRSGDKPDWMGQVDGYLDLD